MFEACSFWMGIIYVLVFDGHFGLLRFVLAFIETMHTSSSMHANHINPISFGASSSTQAPAHKSWE
jgi:hypothetical protein